MTRAELPLAVATDALCASHVAPPNHDEDPERLLAAQRGLEQSYGARGALRLEPRDADPGELARAHTPGFVEQVLGSRGKDGWFDEDTYHSPKSADVALRATGAALALTDALLDGTCRQGVGLWRPPGHHSCADRALGFCLFNHVAVAARHARKRGASRVLVVDWDVHHGNGTQAIFEDDPSVLFISLHQGRPQYPESGDATETGVGEGLGYTVNLPLSVGATGATYAHAFDRVVLPIVEQYAPDLTLVSAGYDAHEFDPLGGMCLRADDYAWMARRLVETLGGRDGARIGFCLEGGYNRRALTECVRRTLDALGTSEPIPDPRTQQSVNRRHATELAVIEQVQREYWDLD